MATLGTEKIKQLSSMCGLSDDLSVVGLPQVRELQLPIASMMVHKQQFHTNQHSLVPICKLIRQLKNQEVINKWLPHWEIKPQSPAWQVVISLYYRSSLQLIPSEMF